MQRMIISGTSANTTRWITERNKHPFIGENVSEERYSKLWEDSADKYIDAGIGELKDRVLSKMEDLGLIGEEIDILDIGSGPGTYGIPFSEKCRSVTCMDGSQKMLDRIISERRKNISCVRSDWESFTSERRYHTVFSSLCPALNDPKSILRMESFSEGWCAYISSMNDDSNSIQTEIWRELGKDYTYNGYNTRYPFNFLKENGRSPILEVFECRSTYELPEKEAIEKLIDEYSFFMDVDTDIRSVIENVVKVRSKKGIVHYEGIKRIGLLMWRCGFTDL